MVSAEGYLEIARKMIESHEDIFTTVAMFPDTLYLLQMYMIY
jgi:hypothetical protein